MCERTLRGAGSMSATPRPAVHGEASAAEDTGAGRQTLLPGVAPTTLGDRAAVLGNANGPRNG